MKKQRRLTLQIQSNQNLQNTPKLQKRHKTVYEKTQSNQSDKLSLKRITTELQPESRNKSYEQLTLQSIRKKYPVSRLYPYSSYNSTKKLQQQLNAQQIYQVNQESQTNINLLKRRLFKAKSTQKAKTFYQTKNKFKKSKTNWKTFDAFYKSNNLNQESTMVSDYIKDLKQVQKGKQLKLENINIKIIEQYPQFFQRNKNIKNRSNSLQCGILKRKTNNIEQKYKEPQPGHYYPIKSYKNTTCKPIDKNLSFCIFARTKQRLMNTEKPKFQDKQQQKFQKQLQNLNLNKLDLNDFALQKFKKQSKTYYKYLKNSFLDKKKTLLTQMKISIK